MAESVTTELEPVERLRRDLPTLVVRAGVDNGENPTIDHFVSQALKYETPLTLINQPLERHGFDHIRHASTRERTQEIIEFTLAFLALHLNSG